jgi:hypothetical protein
MLNIAVYAGEVNGTIKKISREAIFFLWFTKWNDFRTIDWGTKLKFPEHTMAETQKLLAIAS